MSGPDYDDPAVEEQWCFDMRAQVARYLETGQVSHGQIGKWPAWHVAPYVSVWAIESRTKPGWVGWWVICGDLPTDYVSADEIKHPRKALEAPADRWQGYCAAVRSGFMPDDMTIGGVPDSPGELLPLLESRAKTLAEWASDDSMWEGV